MADRRIYRCRGSPLISRQAVAGEGGWTDGRTHNLGGQGEREKLTGEKRTRDAMGGGERKRHDEGRRGKEKK